MCRTGLKIENACVYFNMCKRHIHFYELTFKINSVFSKLYYTGLKLLFKLPFTLTNQVNGFKNQLQR